MLCPSLLHLWFDCWLAQTLAVAPKVWLMQILTMVLATHEALLMQTVTTISSQTRCGEADILLSS